MRIVFYLPLLFLLYSCASRLDEKELYGSYVPINYKNTFDTLQLKSEGAYHRRVYDINKKLLLDFEGKWAMVENGQVKLNGFFQNLDVDLLKFPETIQDPGMELITDFEKKSDIIQFCTGHYQGENCYRKIK